MSQVHPCLHGGGEDQAVARSPSCLAARVAQQQGNEALAEKPQAARTTLDSSPGVVSYLVSSSLWSIRGLSSLLRGVCGQICE